MGSDADPCVSMHDLTLSRQERKTLHHDCNLATHADMHGLDNAVTMLGGFLGAADRAVNDEMTLEATDPTYVQADETQVEHTHAMQHTDIAMRAISTILGFSHEQLQSVSSPAAPSTVPPPGTVQQ